MTRLAALFIAVWGAVATSSAAAERVTVFAAASLRGALEEIAAGTPNEVSLSFGGSGTMARQVAAGAPADVVVLASTLWMDWLVSEGVIAVDEAVFVATNRLVLIGPQGAAALDNLADLPARLGNQRLAMGHREAVPAGTYARQWLEAAGLWDAVQDQLAETDNVRAALSFVARGAAPLGIVYASDALAEPAVKVLWQVPPSAHEAIQYPAAALTPKGHAFLANLTSARAAAIFASHGFTPVHE